MVFEFVYQLDALAVCIQSLGLLFYGGAQGVVSNRVSCVLLLQERMFLIIMYRIVLVKNDLHIRQKE